MRVARRSGVLMGFLLTGTAAVAGASPSLVAAATLKPAAFTLPDVGPPSGVASGPIVEASLGAGAQAVATGSLLQLGPLLGMLALDVEGLRPTSGVTAGPDPAPSGGARPRIVRSDKRRLQLVRTISGGLAPKSIVGTPSGRFFAQNVTYLHTISVFDRRFKRIATISDTVRLRWLRAGRSSVKVQGAPVEAAVSVDGRSLFVSQYSMYGPGFWSPGFDLCTEDDVIDESYVYRIDVATLRKVRAYRVGEVPKFLAASPDGRHLLVANWCSMDVSVVDLRRGREVARIPVGLNPRGIAFSPDGSLAWVSVVGERRLVTIDMGRLRVKRTLDAIGIRPRHLVMSRNGRALYVALEGYEIAGQHDGSVLKLDPTSGAVLGRVERLLEPRTMVLAPDGRSLYVVDYLAGRLVKIETASMRVLQSVPLGYHPIGVTYDAATAHVWVAGYGGSIWVLKDRARSGPDRRASS